MTKVKNISGTEFEWNQSLVDMMDDETREKLHRAIAPCSEQEFMSAYENEHERVFGEVWELSKENPTW